MYTPIMWIAVVKSSFAICHVFRPPADVTVAVLMVLVVHRAL